MSLQSFRAQRFCGPWAGEIWGIPDADKSAGQRSHPVEHLQLFITRSKVFSNDSNSILRRVETRIVWGLGGSMWNPQRCRKLGIC